jgi:hypothetical protein
LVPERLDTAGCGTDAQAQAIALHRSQPDFRDGLSAREVARAEAYGRKAKAAADRDDVQATVGLARQAVEHYGRARAAQPAEDRMQRIALDEAATLMGVTAGELVLRRAEASMQARRQAKQLIDQVLAASPQDPEVAAYARELASKWSELPAKGKAR